MVNSLAELRKKIPLAKPARLVHISATKAVFFTVGALTGCQGACGCSSGVEHNLAKVGVVGSNPIARSILPLYDPETWVTQRT